MTNSWRTILRTLLALGLLVTAACGSDDEDPALSGVATTAAPEEAGGDEEEQPAEDGSDYCGALQAFHTQIFQVQLEDDATEEDIQAAFDTLDPLWADVEASAPDEHADAIDELGASIDALGEGDAESFNADDTATTYFSMVSDSLDGCVDEVIEITGVDFAFTGVPETMPSGPIGLRFTNGTDADEQHEFIIFKKADGETRTAEEILNDPATQEQGPGEFAGAVFATPGTTAGTFLDLAPGEYIAVCFIPVGSGELSEEAVESGEEEGGPPHFTQGMVAEFTVA